MEIDTLEGVQLGGITQWIRVRGADAANPVLLLMQQGPGLPMINEARRLERLLGLERLHGRLLGPAGHRAVITTTAHEPGPVRDQRGANGRRHGDTAGVASRPIRWQDIRRRVLLRRDVRRLRRCAAPRAGGGIGGDRHGHRRARGRGPRLRLRARRRPPTRQPARDPAAGGHRPAPAHNREAVHAPGPAGWPTSEA